MNGLYGAVELRVEVTESDHDVLVQKRGHKQLQRFADKAEALHVRRSSCRHW